MRLFQQARLMTLSMALLLQNLRPIFLQLILMQTHSLSPSLNIVRLLQLGLNDFCWSLVQFLLELWVSVPAMATAAALAKKLVGFSLPEQL